MFTNALSMTEGEKVAKKSNHIPFDRANCCCCASTPLKCSGLVVLSAIRVIRFSSSSFFSFFGAGVTSPCLTSKRQLIRICWRKGLCFRNAFSKVTLLPDLRATNSVAGTQTRSYKAGWSRAGSTTERRILRCCVNSLTHSPLHRTMLRVRCLRGGSRGAEAAHLIGAMVGNTVVSYFAFVNLFLFPSFFYYYYWQNGI